MRILLVSQFWPSEETPELGIFVAQLAGALERRGHTIDRAVITTRGGPPTKHARLVAEAVRAARSKPDVVFAHFLFPAGIAGVAASLAARAPLVVMAHGQDVRNVGAVRGVRAATAAVVRRANTVIFNSAYLRDQLPLTPRRSEVIDCGVDLDTFRHRDQADARAQLGLPTDLPRPVVLFAGALIERKNVLRLREAMTEGTLLVAGDGPHRPQLEGDANVHLAGRQPYDRMPTWMAAADVVALPSLEEPFGQALLEAMASERSVVATRQGGPPEFVTPEAGALVDPLDTSSISEGLHHAASLGSPNPAARAAAAPHALDAQAERMEAVLRRAAS